MTPADKLGGASVVAFVLLVAFAIDRIVSGILFVLAGSRAWAAKYPDPDTMKDDDPAKPRAVRSRKAWYFGLSLPLSVAVLAVVGTGMLHHVGFASGPLDFVLTLLILMGGAQQVSEFTKSLSPVGAPREPEVKVTGTLELDEGRGARAAGR